MPNRENFPEVFSRLKTVMQEAAPSMLVKTDTADNYYLEVPKTDPKDKDLFFGAVQLKKNYVSYHLVPLYMFPELIQDMSEPLKKRMQGKACFNFTTLDETLLTELAELTRTALKQVQRGYPTIQAMLSKKR